MRICPIKWVVPMVFAKKRQQGRNEAALLAAIDLKLARLGPAIHGRPDQAELVWKWLNELLDQRIEVTRR